jgi:hypothetical protein
VTTLATQSEVDTHDTRIPSFDSASWRRDSVRLANSAVHSAMHCSSGKSALGACKTVRVARLPRRALTALTKYRHVTPLESISKRR